MKYNKIALIGMMGCGKSTISKILSNELEFNLIELDEQFEAKYRISIKEYFKQFGEKNFRIEETEILKSAIEKENIVLSCGGGIILKEENRDILFNRDILTIYLKTSSDEIYKRIKNDTTRPLLQVKNPKEEIAKIINNREIFYNKAKIIVNTDNKIQNEIVEEILKKYGQYSY